MCVCVCVCVCVTRLFSHVCQVVGVVVEVVVAEGVAIGSGDTSEEDFKPIILTSITYANHDVMSFANSLIPVQYI